jgi:hypothetical protein
MIDTCVAYSPHFSTFIYLGLKWRVIFNILSNLRCYGSSIHILPKCSFFFSFFFPHWVNNRAIIITTTFILHIICKNQK